ncbi:hypothetical protein CAPTEDRAFT_187071 [Capitella teleta]|uniref:Major facilitator superfamily (MFS) profile domain-containing protein n=1 Tax=Capitella teleta TaxID=283909 RepID=R7V6D8_CAPTE|nr:hypothetical protein CAPTEDRAFT_187071 [Capitella teleta]|eukprot:ELU11320.1 hypothetical protein CAPTEDRAFT_187071 [Capitella teleta]
METNKVPKKPRSIETKRSVFILVTAFLAQCLYGIGLFNPTVYFVVYVRYFNVSGQVGAWTTAIYAACCFFIGIIASPFISHYGCRITASFGGFVCALSLAISAFSPNIASIFVFQSALAGCGAGAVFISANVIISHYFDKHRSQAATFSLSGMGVGMLVSPLLATCLIDQLGWRGSMLIQSALMAHMIPLGLTFTPPKPLPVTTTSKKSFSALIKSSFDFSVLKDTLFLVYCLSSFLIRVNSTGIITHLPKFLVSQGFSLDEAAQVASVSGGCNLVARFMAIFLTSYPHLDATLVFSVFMLVNALSVVILILVRGMVSKCVAAGIFGFSFGFDYPFVPVILCALKGPKMLPVSMGVYNLVSMATVIISVPPIIGLLVDVTGSYDLPLSMAVALSAIGCLSLLFSSQKLKKSSKTHLDCQP